MTKENGRFNDNLRVFIRCRPVLVTENASVTDQSTYSLVRVIDNKLVVILDPEKVYREQVNGSKDHYAGGQEGDSDLIKPLSKHYQHDVLRANRSREKQYAFDCVFDGPTTQEQVFEKCVNPLLDSVIDGYNATCFAYGQTGSGKTYTMLGPEDSPGIMFRALQGIFDRITISADYEFKITLSYLEIYNENIRDLLNPSDEYLELREDNDRMHVVGLTEMTVKSVKETMLLLRKGNQNRIQEETSHNKESSRSHAVLQILVEKRNKIKDVSEEVQIGKLSLIDLAGSERAAESNNKGLRLREGANINRSLLALGNCINALGQRNSKGGYIPYRDSKLTRLLKDSLGGNCRTSMISCISPTNYEDTINTLKYANRAKNIRMTVTRNTTSVNHHIVHYTSIINELRGEISNLKQKLVVTNKQLNFQKKQVSQANLKRSIPEIDEEYEKLIQQVVSNFEEMMQARKSVIELEALELANKLQIRNLQLDMSQSQESLLKSPISKRNHLQQSVTKIKKEILDLSDNMIKNSKMKAEFQANYENLETLAITLKEKLKLATPDDRQKQEFLTQLFRLHLLELQNAELQSFQNKQVDLMKEKDVTIQNLMMQIQIRDTIISQMDCDIEFPPTYISLNEYAPDFETFTSRSSGLEAISNRSRNHIRVQSDDIHLPPISIPMEDGNIFTDTDADSDLAIDNAIQDFPSVRTSSRTRTERSDTPSPRSRSRKVRNNIFSTPPPQRRYSGITTPVISNQQLATDSGNHNVSQKKKSTKKVDKRNQNKHRLLSKIYGYTPLGKKSNKKKKQDEKKDDTIDNLLPEGRELFTKKNPVPSTSLPDTSASTNIALEKLDNEPDMALSHESARISLHQARILRKQRMKHHRPKTNKSHGPEDILLPERAESPEQPNRSHKSGSNSDGSRVSSSVDMEYDSRFPILHTRRRLQSVPVSQSYEDNFIKKMRLLEKQRQLLHRTP